MQSRLNYYFARVDRPSGVRTSYKKLRSLNSNVTSDKLVAVVLVVGPVSMSSMRPHVAKAKPRIPRRRLLVDDVRLLMCGGER